jgi:hypothetical protein
MLLRFLIKLLQAGFLCGPISQLALHEGRGNHSPETLMKEQFHFTPLDLLLRLSFGDLPSTPFCSVFSSLFVPPRMLSYETIKHKRSHWKWQI